ncbi:hypothetical protein RB195_018164 [Necator americanus]|uniref:Uncharacterized protein n=1 Tax=Necator americanus TaxID=51031 RepID=A0ABR1C8H2_NECAM
MVIVGIDANARMVLDKQSNVLGKCYYTMEDTSDNGNHLSDAEETSRSLCSTCSEGPEKLEKGIWGRMEVQDCDGVRKLNVLDLERQFRQSIAGNGISTNGSVLRKLLLKIEKLGQSYVQRRSHLDEVVRNRIFDNIGPLT